MFAGLFPLTLILLRIVYKRLFTVCMYVYVYILSIRSSGRVSEEKGRVHIELTVTLTSVQIHAICMMTLHCYCKTIDLHSTF